MSTLRHSMDEIKQQARRNATRVKTPRETLQDVFEFSTCKRGDIHFSLDDNGTRFWAAVSNDKGDGAHGVDSRLAALRWLARRLDEGLLVACAPIVTSEHGIVHRAECPLCGEGTDGTTERTMTERVGKLTIWKHGATEWRGCKHFLGVTHEHVNCHPDDLRAYYAAATASVWVLIDQDDLILATRWTEDECYSVAVSRDVAEVNYEYSKGRVVLGDGVRVDSIPVEGAHQHEGADDVEFDGYEEITWAGVCKATERLCTVAKQQRGA